MEFKNGVKNIQAAGYNGVHMYMDLDGKKTSHF